MRNRSIGIQDTLEQGLTTELLADLLRRVDAARGSRIEDLRLAADGTPIDPGRDYVVSGWASVSEDVEGPPIYDVVSAYLREQGSVAVAPGDDIELV